MEGWTEVERLLVYALGFGMVLALIGAWIMLWRWSWKQRGIGLAQGWFTVVDQRGIHASTRGAAPAQAPRPGERMADSAMVSSPPSTPAPEPTKRAPAGPPRYLVPTEKE
jgi:hypothetical protein